MKTFTFKHVMFMALGLIGFDALASQTTIAPGVILYSEYYPNFKSKFKGTIVFENGSGMAMEQWTQYKKFFSCVEKQGSVFLYDRNGLGKSKPDFNTSTKHPITAKLVTEKLMKLLKQKHVPFPYIIVGHSYGGIYADYFARRYPQWVEGMLLIDPVPQSLAYSSSFKKQQAYLNTWASIPNKILYRTHTYEKEKKSHFKRPAAEVFYQSRGIEETRAQMNQLPPLPQHIPIFILSSSQVEREERVNPTMLGGWFKQQGHYLNKNPHSAIFKVDASHAIWVQNPDIVCAKIKKLVQLGR